MKIFNALENKELFKQKITNFLDSVEEIDEYFYNFIINDIKNYENIYFSLDENDEYKSLFIKSKDFDNQVLELFDDFDENEYEYIKNNFPNAILSISNYYCSTPPDYYKPANLENSLDPTSKYALHNAFFIPKTLDINVIRDFHEKELPILDKSKIHFENLSYDELTEQINEKYKNSYFTGMQKTSGNFFVTEHFHYLSFDFSDQDKSFLVCKQDDTLLGVIKYGIYGFTDNKHQAVAYIDVNDNYRNNGIATLLIKELNKYVNKNMPLLLTEETELGHKCHMERLFLDNITATACFTHNQEQECFKNLDNNQER